MEIRVLASGSSGNAYIVSDGSTALLLDAGIPMRELRQRCGFSLHRIAGCLVTHAHMDHAKAVPGLIKAGMDVYTSRGTIDALQVTGHRVHALAALKTVRIGTWSVLPFEVEHDVPEPLGFLCASLTTGEKLLYLTDTFYCRYRFQGLTHAMLECNYDTGSLLRSTEEGHTPYELSARLAKSHMSLENLLGMLAANDLSKLKQIYLIHLSSSNSNAELMRREVQRATGAEVYVAHDLIT